MAKTSTTTKLEQALAKIQEGITLLKEARDENKTLRGHYNKVRVFRNPKK